MWFKDEFLRLLGNETIYNLSKNTGIERTKLQRIKSGKRQPNKEDIEKIARALFLSAEEKQALYRAYEIDLIGVDRYKCRVLSMKFLNDITAICEKKSSPRVQNNLNSSFEIHGEVVVTRSTSESIKLITALVAAEISAGSEICIFTDSYDELIFNALSSLLGSNETCPNVKHLIALRPIDETHESYLHNMNVITGIYPIVINNCNYYPNYIYSSHDSSCFLPYYIITDNYSVNFSRSLSEAVIIRNPELVNTNRKIFMGRWQNSYSFIYEIRDIFAYIDYYMNNLNNFKDEPVYSLESEPCLAFFITENLILKYIKRDFPDCDIIINRAKSYFTGQEDLAVKKVFFQERGLDSFIQTGQIKEIPEMLCRPFSINDRIAILRKMIAAAKAKKKYFPMMIKPEAMYFHENIRFYGTGCMEDIFILLRDDMDGFSSILALNDSGLSIPFFDFVKSLEGSESVYTVDETIQIIQNKLDSLIAKLNI